MAAVKATVLFLRSRQKHKRSSYSIFFFFSIFTSVGRRVVVSDGFLRDLTCGVVSRGSFYSMFTRNWNDGEFTKTDKGTMSYDGEGRVT